MAYKNLINHYKGKRVFITGHTGFKGSWLLRWLKMLGAEIKGYALPAETESHLYNVIQGDTLCESIIGDIRDKDKLKKELIKFKPDFVFHLAAQPLVQTSYLYPTETFSVNAIGTANLLDCLRFVDDACSIIIVTTDKVYHNNEWSYPYRETDRLGGYDPYSASKACSELIINSYRDSYFNISDYSLHRKSIAVARAGNVIGGGDCAENRLVPDIIKALKQNTSIIIRNPHSIRPWQHVLEPLYGYLLLGAELSENPVKFSTAYNFGPQLNDSFTVKQLVKKAIDIWGTGNYSILAKNNLNHEAGELKLDISKSWAELKWKPRYTIVDSIQLTLDWYKTDSSEEQIITLMDHQIEKYMDLCKQL